MFWMNEWFQLNEQMNERTNEQTNEQMKDQTNELFFFIYTNINV